MAFEAPGAEQEAIILTTMMTATHASEDHVNTGMLALRVSGDDRTLRTGPITVIVSGVGRSGTSMVAKVLDSLGLSMGQTDGLAVFEDQHLNRALFQFDYTLVRKLISERDAVMKRWGFKFASLQNHMFPAQLEFFRNPRLIIVMRDVVATASRSFISDDEKKAVEVTLANVAKQTSDMVNFITNTTYPTLLVSYEKFVGMPDEGIAAVADFCGIALTDELRRAAHLAIEPNNPQYIELFHPNCRGSFDSVIKGQVIGWCARDDRSDPVEVELLADGSVIAVAVADIYRADLLQAGIGSGVHGFRFDISGLGLGDDVILQVRTLGGGYVVGQRARRLGDFPER